ncbi:MAG: hypothetical protein QM690_21130, partial [Sphingobium sp.]
MKAVLGLSVAVSILALAIPAAAQNGAIVQPTPSSQAVERLNQNLNRLSRQPTDMEALIGAGMASYELGDAQAANGFFTRANMVNSREGRAKLGLALVSLSLKQPREAAAYFDDADALGVRADKYLAERALAYDLTGQQDKAQQDYAVALRADPGNAELIRAYAVSLGISGRVDLAEAQLRPLLFKSDRAAWRDRTMILAMNGRTAEARRIAQTIMPRNLSDALDPYLIRMGALNPAQKAAAARYGQFPADGLRLATVTTPPAAAQAATRADSAARRPGASSGGSSRDRRKGAAPVQPAAPAEDSSLLAAMPRGDAPPAMVQPIPAQPSVQSAPAATAARGRDMGDDDPDGWTAAERRQAERRVPAAQPVQPAPTGPAAPSAPASQPVRTAEAPTRIRTGPVPSYATTAARSGAANQPVQTVQSVPRPAAPVETVQPIPQPAAPARTVQPVPAAPVPAAPVPVAPAQPLAQPPVQTAMAVPPSPQPAPVQGPAFGGTAVAASAA